MRLLGDLVRRFLAERDRRGIDGISGGTDQLLDPAFEQRAERTFAA